MSDERRVKQLAKHCACSEGLVRKDLSYFLAEKKRSSANRKLWLEFAEIFCSSFGVVSITSRKGSK